MTHSRLQILQPRSRSNQADAREFASRNRCVMNYDGAGNLTTDTYSGNGSRTYDAENRMTSAQGINQGSAEAGGAACFAQESNY